MAKVNRDFFIPYIKNLCALHLLQRKLYGEARDLEYRIQMVSRGEQEPALNKPCYESVWTDGRVIAIVGAILWGTPWIISFFANLNFPASFYFVGVLCLSISALIIVFTLKGVNETKRYNSYKSIQYYDEERRVKQIRDRNELARKRDLPVLRSKLISCNAAYEETRMILERSYGANVIPGQYRNIHAMVYLYDWFSKSMEDDLGMALNTFVLEQIKDRLDEIIRNQGEMILNQQMQLSLQMQSLDELTRHNQAMEQKLNQLQLTEDERNRNIEMLNQTNASLMWYAQQEYIKNMY